MRPRTKYIIAAALFGALLLFGGLGTVIAKDRELSHAERRRLAQAPRLSAEGLLDGGWFEKLDGYVSDQFIFRDKLRTLSALSALRLFGRRDFHGLYLAGGVVVKQEYPLNEERVLQFAALVNRIRESILSPEQRVFYSVIPDKNYFYAEKAGRLSIDYEKLLDILGKNLAKAGYIDIFNALSGEDYYKTDSHWRQERLGGVARALASGMGLEENPFPTEYEALSFSPFYGVYYGQSALPLPPEELVYLATKETKSALVSHIEDKSGLVYDTELLTGMDSYDVFLSGASSVCEITNTLNPGGRELIIFRDSYTSSLAPMLLSGYGKITLVDIRYINASLLPQYVDFANQDALFYFSGSQSRGSTDLPSL